jgi:hypothetical protein
MQTNFKTDLESLRPQIGSQLLLVTESVQIGNPDFLDDRVEAAASGVVANEKETSRRGKT